MEELQLVKYHNDINKLKFTGFTQYDIDLFWSIVSLMNDTSGEMIVIDYDEAIRLSGLNPRDKRARDRAIWGMCFRLSNLPWNMLDIETYSFDTDRRIFGFRGDTKEGKLYARIDRDFLEWLDELTKNFTVFELKDLVNLKSKYSKHLFRLLKQWRTTGSYCFYDLEEFKALLDIPDSYKNKYILDRIIKPSIEDIKSLGGTFENLNYEVIKERKKGAPIKGYKFTWTPEAIETKAKAKAEPKDESKPKRRGRPPKAKTHEEKFGFESRDYTADEMADLENLLLDY